MNESLRDRILKKLDTLGDERGYQVLDYVDFLESRYAERQNPQNAFTRFTDSIEGTLRAGKVSASTIAETMGFLNKASGVLNSALAAGKSMANDLYQSGSNVVQNLNTPPRVPNDAGSSQQPPSAAPGSPEEKL